jgi:hypothetical protein
MTSEAYLLPQSIAGRAGKASAGAPCGLLCFSPGRNCFQHGFAFRGPIHSEQFDESLGRNGKADQSDSSGDQFEEQLDGHAYLRGWAEWRPAILAGT